MGTTQMEDRLMQTFAELKKKPLKFNQIVSVMPLYFFEIRLTT